MVNKIKHLSQRTKHYLILLFLAVIFNSLAASWPEFKDHIDPIIWASVNGLLGVLAGVIRTLAVIEGVPTTVEEAQAAEAKEEDTQNEDNTVDKS